MQGDFWEAIAKVCDGRPTVFAYNLMNEPLASPMTAAIRKHDQRHLITIGLKRRSRRKSISSPSISTRTSRQTRPDRRDLPDEMFVNFSRNREVSP